jgi:hypothetical protein
MIGLLPKLAAKPDHGAIISQHRPDTSCSRTPVVRPGSLSKSSARNSRRSSGNAPPRFPFEITQDRSDRDSTPWSTPPRQVLRPQIVIRSVHEKGPHYYNEVQTHRSLHKDTAETRSTQFTRTVANSAKIARRSFAGPDPGPSRSRTGQPRGGSVKRLALSSRSRTEVANGVSVWHRVIAT